MSGSRDKPSIIDDMRTIGVKTAYPEEHTHHLCYMVSRQQLLARPNKQRLNELVSPPNFVCADCGRAAAKAENLCNPVKR